MLLCRTLVGHETAAQRELGRSHAARLKDGRFVMPVGLALVIARRGTSVMGTPKAMCGAACWMLARV
jgi:hypothetical protein